MSSESRPEPLSGAGEPEWLALVRSQVRDLRYGVVQLVVHDGVRQVAGIQQLQRHLDVGDFALDLALFAALFSTEASHEEFTRGDLQEFESDFVAEVEDQFSGGGCR